MRFYVTGLLLCAALSVSQAQEAPPLDTSELVQQIEIVRASDLSEVETLERPVILDGEDVSMTNVSLGWPLYVTLASANAAGEEGGLTPQAQSLFDELSQIPAEQTCNRAVGLQRLQDLQDAYTRMDWLDEAAAIRERLRKITGQAAGTRPDPGNLTAFRGQVGKTFRFNVIGRTQGCVWGSGLYTDDSVLQAAVVHAGALREGQTGIVKVTILDGQPHYDGAERNGIISQSYENWRGSYRIEAEKAPTEAAAQNEALPQAAKDLLAKLTQIKNENGGEKAIRAELNALQTMELSAAKSNQLDAALALRDAHLHFVGDALGAVPYPGPLTSYRSKRGQSVYFYVTGRGAGSVWGSGVYTDDSALGAVTVHAGLLRPGQKGLIKVSLLPGQTAYEGQERNGVVSQPYAAWEGSYRVEAVRF